MLEKTLKILCCPVCRGELVLKDLKKEGNKIIGGILKCEKCGREYRIKDGIPDLTP